jgi:hypothetical protein
MIARRKKKVTQIKEVLAFNFFVNKSTKGLSEPEGRVGALESSLVIS